MARNNTKVKPAEAVKPAVTASPVEVEPVEAAPVEEAAPVVASAAPKAPCRFCDRVHPKSFDGPGINHDAFNPGGRQQAMFGKLCDDPKIRFFIPFLPGEKDGATQSPCLNGLRINILKGRYVDIPQGVADILMESLQQTAAATVNLKVRNPMTGEVRSARLDLRDERDRGALAG